MTALRLALRLQYDGSAFAGSQRQPRSPTVQAALEAAVEALTGERPGVRLAGRTDAGVHALGQVASLRTAQNLPLVRWVRGLNHFLPPAVAVQAARWVPPAFDPRRDARDRTYCYRVRCTPQRQPLWAARTWQVRESLDESAMEAALRRLPGERDFASFAGRPAQPGSSVRRLEEARLSRDGPEWCFHFRAEAFLPHQVRRTVGQVVAIGRGHAAPSLVDRLLADPRYGAAGPAAPPQGLYLVRVRYDLAELEGWEPADDNVRNA